MKQWYSCVALVLTSSLLANGAAALTLHATGDAPGLITRVQQLESPTSGAIPPSQTSGAIPPSPTSGAIISPLTPSQNFATSPGMTQRPLATPGPQAPYQPPCGTYPLPQC